MTKSKIENIEILNLMIEAFSKLNTKERLVILNRYGLLGDSMLTLSKAGNKLHLTRERIRQIEDSALNKLKECNIKK